MKKIEQELKFQISRRDLITTLAGAAAVAAVGTLAEAEPTLANGKPVVPDDDSIFPILAAWLLISTNPSFLSVSPATVQAQTGIGAVDAQAALDQAKANPALYKQIATEFDTLRKNAGYSHPQCPILPTLLSVTSAHVVAPANANPSSKPQS